MNEVYNFDRYKLFYYVALYRNMSTAAKALGVVPSTISKAVNRLEEELNCKLFVRSAKGNHLSAEGEELYRRIKPAIEMLNVASNNLTEMQSKPEGVIRISSSYRMANTFLIPYVLPSFLAQYPGIKVQIQYIEEEEVQSTLDQGTADIIVSSLLGLADDKAEAIPLLTSNNIGVVGKQMSSLAERTLGVRDLANLPCIFTAKNHLTRLYYEAVFKSEGFQLEPVIEVPSAVAQVHAAAAGLGYTFVPELTALDYILRGDLIKLDLDFEQPLPKVEFLLIPKGTLMNNATSYLVDTIMFYASEMTNRLPILKGDTEA
ncbi:MAG: LysR family transcriptional regulator [Clostridiales bacterium]|nr:LysR family transcriptional regulator [Clostridiales bacterium]